MAKPNNVPAATGSKAESVLAYMATGVIGFSLLIIGVLLFAYATGIKSLPVLLPLLPFIGLPLGMLLIIALVIVSIRRRTRESK
jgi:hypothetical protein